MIGRLLGGKSEGKFWKWFVENKEQIAAINDGDLLIQPKLEKNLRKFDKVLSYELSRNTLGQNQFYVSPQFVREEIPSAMSLADSAPHIDGWNIEKFIPKKDTSVTLESNELSMKQEHLRFECTLYKSQAHLRVYIVNYDLKDERYRALAVMFLKTAFGEFDYITKIGALEYVPFTGYIEGKKIITLDELIELVNHEVR